MTTRDSCWSPINKQTWVLDTFLVIVPAFNTESMVGNLRATVHGPPTPGAEPAHSAREPQASDSNGVSPLALGHLELTLRRFAVRLRCPRAVQKNPAIVSIPRTADASSFHATGMARCFPDGTVCAWGRLRRPSPCAWRSGTLPRSPTLHPQGGVPRPRPPSPEGQQETTPSLFLLPHCRRKAQERLGKPARGSQPTPAGDRNTG